MDKQDKLALIMLGFGVLVGMALWACVVEIHERVYIPEQVEIPKEEIECIGSYKVGAFLSVWKIHDNRDNVTCWILGERGGMACIPDHMLSP